MVASVRPLAAADGLAQHQVLQRRAGGQVGLLIDYAANALVRVNVKAFAVTAQRRRRRRHRRRPAAHSAQSALAAAAAVLHGDGDRGAVS